MAEVVSCNVVRVALLALECPVAKTEDTLDFDLVFFALPFSFTISAVWAGGAAFHALDFGLSVEAIITVFALKGVSNSIPCSERPDDCCGHGVYFQSLLGFKVLIVSSA